MTFDLEKTRAKSIEFYGWAEAFDGALAEIERLRLAYDTLRSSFLELNLLSGKKNIRIREQADRIQELEDTLVEERADRLRPYEKVAADLQACGSYVGIGPGEGDLPIPERVRRCVNRLKETQNHYSQKLIAKDAEIERLRAEMDNYGDDFVCQMKSKDARIKELEDALVEDRAVDIAYDEGHLWSRLLQVDGGQRQEEYRERARSQLQLEGKIGNGPEEGAWRQ